MIEESQQIWKEPFSFNSEIKNKDNNSEPSLVNNTFPTLAIMLLNKVTHISINPCKSIKQLCNPCIESKYIRIVRHKNMTLITYKLEEIYADLWRPQNLFSRLRKTYVGLFFHKFIYKSWILFFGSKNKFLNWFFQVFAIAHWSLWRET